MEAETDDAITAFTFNVYAKDGGKEKEIDFSVFVIGNVNIPRKVHL